MTRPLESSPFSSITMRSCEESVNAEMTALGLS